MAFAALAVLLTENDMGFAMARLVCASNIMRLYMTVCLALDSHQPVNEFSKLESRGS